MRMPVKGRDGLVELDSRTLPGKLTAGGPADADPADFDLVVLAMQEPQYRSPGVRELLDAVAKARVPCMSIMNMPPLPYLMRIPAIAARRAAGRATPMPSVWDGFDPKLMTLCSPDAQAFRPPEEKVNVLQVRLADQLQGGALRFGRAHGACCGGSQRTSSRPPRAPATARSTCPVKLRVHDSVFVPLAKWAMLLAGNYRCVRRGRRAQHQGRGPRRHRRLASRVRMGRRAVRVARRRRERSRALRKIRERGADACKARRPRRARSPPARPTSSAPIGSCRRSRRKRACARDRR